jgi:MarR family 2-MHQ and catechol resistance regulon transcriptional repressor
MTNQNQNQDDSLDLFIALQRATEWINAHADRDIKHYALNRTEFGVLELLFHKGSQPLQRIGGKVLMSSGNITYVMDKLEKKELVKRKASLEDRRLIYAEITDKGKQFIEEVFPKHMEVIDKAVNGLTHQEKQTVSQLLKKLGKYAEEGF